MKSASSRPAAANGIQLLSRTRLSCSVGLSRPGNSCSSSSRGEKARPTFWADAIFAAQFQLVAAVRLDLSRLAARRMQSAVTVWTAGSRRARRLDPIRPVAGQRGVLQHARAHLTEPLVNRRLDFLQARTGMLQPPL